MIRENTVHFSDDPKKQVILEAALQEFAESGYNGTSTRQIAKRADIAHGLIYYYFKNKESLYLELCRLVRLKIMAFVLDGVNEDDIYEALLTVCKNKLEYFAAYPAMYKVTMDEIRLFPRAFQTDGQTVRKDISLWNSVKSSENSDMPELEILESALNGLNDRLINLFCAGEMTAEEMLSEGTQKARMYIEFFRKLPHS